MRNLSVCRTVLVLASLLVAAAHAETVGVPNPAHPWEQDQALLDTVKKEVSQSGIRSVLSHITQLESALAGAKSVYIVEEGTGPASYTLVDGPQEALVATTIATMGGEGKDVVSAVSVESPYPTMSLYLGSYYNEVGRGADALRVLDRGLSLSAASEAGLGEHRASLIAEKGAALEALKRWPDVLADFDEGLMITDIDGPMKALMKRGRGMALTELGRLGEAEAAYRESLKDDPGNAHALNELRYIARLRVGAPPTTPSLVLSKEPVPPTSSPAR